MGRERSDRRETRGGGKLYQDEVAYITSANSRKLFSYHCFSISHLVVEVHRLIDLSRVEGTQR